MNDLPITPESIEGRKKGWTLENQGRRWWSKAEEKVTDGTSVIHQEMFRVHGFLRRVREKDKKILIFVCVGLFIILGASTRKQPEEAHQNIACKINWDLFSYGKGQ
jgi:hypothetical protein